MNQPLRSFWSGDFTETLRPSPFHDILYVAIHLIARRGFDGASLREVAKLARMSLSTLQNYFPRQRSLQAKVIDVVHSELACALQPLSSLTQGSDAFTDIFDGLETLVRKRLDEVAISSWVMPPPERVAAVADGRARMLFPLHRVVPVNAQENSLLAEQAFDAYVSVLRKPFFDQRHPLEAELLAAREGAWRVLRPGSAAPKSKLSPPLTF